MPGFSFSKAKELELLNSTEIERLAIMYLAAADEFKPSAQAYKAAAAQAGNTEASFRVLFNKTMKKLQDKECYLEEDDNGGSATVPSPVGTPEGSTKKRKGGDGDGDAEQTPKKTPRGKKAKNAKTVNEEAVSDNAD